jgi:hypothetical protein
MKPDESEALRLVTLEPLDDVTITLADTEHPGMWWEHIEGVMAENGKPRILHRPQSDRCTALTTAFLITRKQMWSLNWRGS